ncbi:MAG: 1-deoxy-D-xylulose-5-phosphate synthase [Verrucomicrobiota bacterium JB022]|nr:1-deoxy-D-xylulose-5-phosphate synthase [Verrucomicrobiota bacterium JB022]
MAILEKIEGPADVQQLSRAELTTLAQEIRTRIIEVTARNGGHIGPNLGVVELTLGLHRVFTTPRDKFVFDVAHQGYVHKLLTGRKGPDFDLIRRQGGLSGFLNRSESEHDAYGAGHAGTALSAALGMCAARDRSGEDSHVVALLGDAAFTCGITMEALNNIDGTTKRLILILNDNEWSIAKNVGALSRYFNEIITNPVYNRLDKDIQSMLGKVPGGQQMLELGRRWKRETKDFFVNSSLFEAYGLRYIGPVDGHDLDAVIKHLEFARDSDAPIILHLLTKKGKGFEPALASPEKFHGLGPFDPQTGASIKGEKTPGLAYQDAFGLSLLKYAERDKKVLGITAAMPPGTGLSYLREKLPEQFFDVGIAEEHAVLFAAGLACEGYKPVVAIYSTFLQRGYDCIVHDVCLQNLHVTFCMDRAGLSPNDGATHHGLFDIAYLRCVPNTIVMQPKDEAELANMLWTSLNTPAPMFIRYPRGNGTGTDLPTQGEILPIGKAEIIKSGVEVQLWALGPWVQEAEKLAAYLEENSEHLSVGVVNARFAKPVDHVLLQQQAEQAKLIVTFEEHTVVGGFGTAVLEALSEAGLAVPLERIGYPDTFVDHGDGVADLRASVGLDPESLQRRLLQRLHALGLAPQPATA